MQVRLRVKITKQKDISLAKLPLCEASKEMYAKKENICIWRLDNYTTFYIHVAKASISLLVIAEQIWTIAHF
jgi:hypothetical protein